MHDVIEKKERKKIGNTNEMRIKKLSKFKSDSSSKLISLQLLPMLELIICLSYIFFVTFSLPLTLHAMK